MRAIINCDIDLSSIDIRDRDLAKEYLNSTWDWGEERQEVNDQKCDTYFAGRVSPETANLERIILRHLGHKGWLSQKLNHQLLEDERKVLQKSFKGEQQELVNLEATKNILLHTPTITWVVLSCPAEYRIEFRLKQPNIDRLKTACESLVRDLQDESLAFSFPKNINDQGASKSDICHGVLIARLDEFIQIYEPGSDHEVLSGKIILSEDWKLTHSKGRADIVVGIITTSIALVLIFLTASWRTDYSFLPLTTERTLLFDGLLVRLAISATVAAIISWIVVLVNYMEGRRKSLHS